jgi:Amt family ammonium transporter
MAYSFFGSCLILFIINMIPGLSLRASEEDEILGIDDAEIGEFAVCLHTKPWQTIKPLY